MAICTIYTGLTKFRTQNSIFVGLKPRVHDKIKVHSYLTLMINIYASKGTQALY